MTSPAPGRYRPAAPPAPRRARAAPPRQRIRPRDQYLRQPPPTASPRPARRPCRQTSLTTQQASRRFDGWAFSEAGSLPCTRSGTAVSPRGSRRQSAALPSPCAGRRAASCGPPRPPSRRTSRTTRRPAGQTLARRTDVGELTAGYGLVVADECHHVPAAAFEDAVRQIPARHRLGLTATPYRRDKLVAGRRGRLHSGLRAGCVPTPVTCRCVRSG